MPKNLNETSQTGDGTVVKLGDTVEINLFDPILVKITSIVQKKNGKVFITTKRADERVETWKSAMIQQPTKIWGLGDKNQPQQTDQQNPPGSDKWDKWQWETYYLDLENKKNDTSKTFKANVTGKPLAHAFGPLVNPKVREEYDQWMKDGGDLSFTDWKKAMAEVYTEEEFAQARTRILNEDPTLLDKIYTPQKGLARTWHVGDVTEHGYKIQHFAS
jgi:hypothetical protein